MENKTLSVALAGQPNTGKSTVFNRLTGLKQHVGNWPGKTVEQKSGLTTFNDIQYRITDLPGTYSLTSNSLEEKIARDYIINEDPDVVVVMADASQLERSLYLLTEIKLLSVPIVLALNMVDVAEEQGKTIHHLELEKQIGVRVVPMVAAKGQGLELLLEAIGDAAQIRGKTTIEPELVAIPCYRNIKNIITDKLDGPCTESWLAVKLIEGDSFAAKTAKKKLSKSDWQKIESELQGLKNGQIIIAGLRYSWINEVLLTVMERKEVSLTKKRGLKFDKAATHPVFGKIIAIFIMILAFAAAMIIAMPVMMAVKPLMLLLTDTVRAQFTGSFTWFGSMLSDGLIPGIGISLMMLSYIFGVYVVFGLLEDVGYVARLAFVFDRSMNRIGLHGKSFMPLLMSFGCNVAGVTSTRVIDSWQQRMVTLVLVSLVPCLALWGVVSFIGTIFFASAMPIVILALLVVMVAYISLTSLILRKFIVQGNSSGLIMELPPYHKPNWKTIFTHVWGQVKSFLKRAFSLIAILSVVTWALSYRADGNMELSVLASIGKFFDPVTSLIGLDWRLFIALLGAVIAKEASLSIIAVLYGLGGGALSITSFLLGSSGVGRAELAGTIAQAIEPASALAFIFAFFFTIPCLGTVGAIYSETKSLKWTIGSCLYYTVGSFLMGGLAYRVGLLIF